MDNKEIDKIILNIAKNKEQLSKLDYSDKKYDKLEDELHELEDGFIEEYEEYFDDIFEIIYEKYNLKSEPLSPLAYIAASYKKSSSDKSGYDVDADQGILVGVDKAGNKCRLVIVPGPLRILFLSSKEKQEAWKYSKE